MTSGERKHRRSVICARTTLLLAAMTVLCSNFTVAAKIDLVSPTSVCPGLRFAAAGSFAAERGNVSIRAYPRPKSSAPDPLLVRERDLNVSWGKRRIELSLPTAGLPPFGTYRLVVSDRNGVHAVPFEIVPCGSGLTITGYRTSRQAGACPGQPVTLIGTNLGSRRPDAQLRFGKGDGMGVAMPPATTAQWPQVQLPPDMQPGTYWLGIARGPESLVRGPRTLQVGQCAEQTPIEEPTVAPELSLLEITPLDGANVARHGELFSLQVRVRNDSERPAEAVLAYQLENEQYIRRGPSRRIEARQSVTMELHLPVRADTESSRSSGFNRAAPRVRVFLANPDVSPRPPTFDRYFYRDRNLENNVREYSYSVAAAEAGFDVWIELVRIDVHDDCDEAGSGDWIVGLSAAASTVGGQRTRSAADFPRQGMARAIAGSPLEPNLRVRLRGVAESSDVTFAASAVECDGESWLPTALPETFVCVENCRCTARQTASGNASTVDFVGRIGVKLSPQQWRAGGPVSQRLQSSADCRAGAFTAHFRVSSGPR